MSRSFNLQDARLVASDGVKARLSPAKLKGGRAVALDYEFAGAGYATVRLAVDLTLTENYAFNFSVLSKGPSNTVEIKMLNESTDTVWWVHRPSFAFSGKWQPLVNKRRHFSYAWGPSREPLSKVAFIELTVTASSGGKGRVYFADLKFEELPLPAENAEPQIWVSSGKASAANLLDGKPDTFWQSTGGGRQIVRLDFASPRELGGLTIDFAEAHAAAYDVEILPVVPGTGRVRKRWLKVDSVSAAGGGRAYHYLPESEAGALRLVLRKSAARSGIYQIASVDVKPLEFGASQSRFFQNVAKDKTHGLYPRYFDDKQSFWTVVGVSGSRQEAIINEEGQVEVGRHMPSIEPFIYLGGELLGWAQGRHEQGLADGYLPMPFVRRTHEEDGISLTVETCAVGSVEDSTLHLRYTVKNLSAARRTGKLYLALRQFQVNPPWQFLNIPGGFLPVNAITMKRNGKGGFSLEARGLESCRIESLSEPDAFGATTFSGGDIVDYLEHGRLPRAGSSESVQAESAQAESAHSESAHAESDKGFASGALAFNFNLNEAESYSVELAVPYTQASPVLSYKDAEAASRAFWLEKLKSVDIELPAYPELVHTVKSQLAYILINRDGVALQPGSRCYRRTWIRDASLTAASLLQLGLHEEIAQFIRWFAPFLYANGKVPCCVDKRGADPTPEHDSHGQFIYLCLEYYRHTGDRALLAEMFPHILGAVSYIERLRQETLGQDFSRVGGGKEHLYGLMPPSISHEGYSAKPAYSYWDDLFALKGLADAREAAAVLGLVEDEQRLAHFHADFRKQLVASVQLTMAHHKIDFIPGAADLGDFDATSTTVGLDPADVLLSELPAQVAATFAKYWQFFTDRRDGKLDWFAYTPYEWRTVGTFVRLGEREKAHALLDYFMHDRRPGGWNHWAEVVYKDPEHNGFIGDAPHGWCGSDFLRSVRSLFAYEHEGALHLFGGVIDKWLVEGVRIGGLSTHFGALGIEARTDLGSGVTVYELRTAKLKATDPGLSAPVYLKLPQGATEVTVNGKPAAITGGAVRVEQLPARVESR